MVQELLVMQPEDVLLHEPSPLRKKSCSENRGKEYVQNANAEKNKSDCKNKHCDQKVIQHQRLQLKKLQNDASTLVTL